ncbi:MAG: hypothetical protein WD895_05325 [Acidimicrobiia bacterium]
MTTSAPAEPNDRSWSGLQPHVGLIATLALFIFVVARILFVARMNTITARAVVATSGAVEVALGIVTSSYWALILLAFVILDVGRRVAARSGRDTGALLALEVLVGLIAVFLVPFWVAVALNGFVLLFQFLDERREKKTGFSAAPIENAMAYVWGLVLSVFVLGGTVWLPPEVIEIDSSRPVVGYVLSADAQWTSILTEAGRIVIVRESESVVGRTICAFPTDRQPPSLIELTLDPVDDRLCEDVVRDLGYEETLDESTSGLGPVLLVVPLGRGDAVASVSPAVVISINQASLLRSTLDVTGGPVTPWSASGSRVEKTRQAASLRLWLGGLLVLLPVRDFARSRRGWALRSCDRLHLGLFDLDGLGLFDALATFG